MSDPILEVADLSVAYGRIEAVRGVSFAVPAGSIVTIIGPNGAGKTTLLNAAMGLLRGRGSIRLQTVEQLGRAVERRVADRMSLVPERRELFTTMSVEDNLVLGGYRLGRRAAVRDGVAEVFARFPKLRERRRQMAGTLSGGERQMLAMGRALMAKPRLLMLDEPSLGLAPLIVREIFRIIADLKRDGVSILLVEQNARAALEIADHGHVMELGRITRSAPAAELLRDPGIIESYLGTRRTEDAVQA